jgi:REP element-mobilizing transposase RayT
MSAPKSLELPMTYARKTLISLQDTPYYHVVARCVRRAWLWGFDEYAGRDYSHRKQWVLERLSELAGIFAIDVCAYAVMSNHYHLVVHVDEGRARRWSHAEVVQRWTQLYSRPPLIERWEKGECESGDREVAEALIERWRERLFDVSWYMRCLNEPLARRANLEDGCTGRFWEGRFKSQALLDEAGLLTAMAYVDLNPIRADIANTPEASEFTSIYQRIEELSSVSNRAEIQKDSPLAHAVPLLRFADEQGSSSAIPFALHEYLSLVDWTGRAIRQDKRGTIDSHLPSIANRLGIDGDAWRRAMRPRGNVFGRAMGRLDHLRLHARTLGQSWVRGAAQAVEMYRS